MAFEELYQRYSKRMLFYFHRNFYGDGEKAQDFLQDLFMKIIEKSNYFDVNKKFSTWIYTLASNLCKNEFRKNAVRKSYAENYQNRAIPQQPPTQSFSREYDYGLFSLSLDRELEQMNEKHRMTFILRHQQGLSIKEISEIMACSEGTVKSRLFNAIKRLANRLRLFNSQTKKH